MRSYLYTGIVRRVSRSKESDMPLPRIGIVESMRTRAFSGIVSVKTSVSSLENRVPGSTVFVVS